MELQKDSLKLTETKAASKASTICDTDVIVPDVKPDILKILQVDGTCSVASKEITDNGINISGIVKYTIFYLPDTPDAVMESISAEQDFSYKLEKHTDFTNCRFDVTSDIERIDFTLLNSRKLGIKATIALSYIVMEDRELTLCSGIDYDRAETIYQPVMVENLQVLEEYTFTMRDRLELPSGRSPISRILKLDARVCDPEIKAITGKAVLKGALAISAIYIDSNNEINTISGEIPFTEISEIFELDEDAPCNADYRISDCVFETATDAEGEACAISFDVTVLAVISLYQKNQMQVLVDCFCPGTKSSMVLEHLCFDNIVSTQNSQYTIKEIISPGENSPEISSVYNLFTKPIINSATPCNGKIDIEGILEVYVSYTTAMPQLPIYTFKHEIPLHFSADDDSSCQGQSCLADISVLHTSFNLNMANEIELRAVLSVSTKLCQKTEFDAISDCQLSEAESASGIVIYFVQPGDTLWNIAKEYSVSISDLVELNSLEKDAPLDVGKKLIIPVC